MKRTLSKQIEEEVETIGAWKVTWVGIHTYIFYEEYSYGTGF